MTTVRLTPSQKKRLQEAAAIVERFSGRRPSQGETVERLAQFALKHPALWAEEAHPGPYDYSRAGAPQDFTMQYHLTGEGGGDWAVAIREGRMTAARGVGEANITFTLGVEDWRDCVLGRNGATLAVIIPQGRAGRPDNSGRAKQLRGTLGSGKYELPHLRMLRLEVHLHAMQSERVRADRPALPARRRTPG